MGEIADQIIEGEICQECTQSLQDAAGYPVSCTECGGDAKIWSPPKRRKKRKRPD